jgi:hypothetical protein
MAVPIDLFNGVVLSWGFSAADIVTNSVFIVGALAAFVLLGIAISYAPIWIKTIKDAVKG